MCIFDAMKTKLRDALRLWKKAGLRFIIPVVVISTLAGGLVRIFFWRDEMMWITIYDPSGAVSSSVISLICAIASVGVFIRHHAGNMDKLVPIGMSAAIPMIYLICWLCNITLMSEGFSSSNEITLLDALMFITSSLYMLIFILANIALMIPIIIFDIIMFRKMRKRLDTQE